jgi:hypothetical protein
MQATTTSYPTNTIFIFGSNEQGFHGAGSAGFAFRGDSANTWRQDKFFLNAIAESRQGKHTVGKRAIFGIARGFMHGIEGDSYAICTVSRPGQKQSRSRKEIARQLRELWHYAQNHPELTFWFTPVGCGYAGYTAAEMQEVIDWLAATIGHPSNIFNLNCYQTIIDKSDT